MDRERSNLERQEKKIIADVKKMAKTGQMVQFSYLIIQHYYYVLLFLLNLQGAVKIMAKDIVRTRNYIKKFYSMRANIQAVSLKLQVPEGLTNHCIISLTIASALKCYVINNSLISHT